MLHLSYCEQSNDAWDKYSVAVKTIDVQVRFFASLRERLGRAEDCVTLPRGATVAQVWDQVSGGEPLPDNVLIAVNMEYAQSEQPVQGEDEVAFFPPVTGG